MCLYDLTGVEPRLNSIIFIDAMGNESNRLMNQIQKKTGSMYNRLYIMARYTSSLSS